MTDSVYEVIKQTPPGAKIIPGHGPLSTPADLKAYHRMLVETLATVRRAMDAGKTLDIIKSAGLGEKWNGWGSGFISTERWIESIFRSFSWEAGTGT